MQTIWSYFCRTVLMYKHLVSLFTRKLPWIGVDFSVEKKEILLLVKWLIKGKYVFDPKNIKTSMGGMKLRKYWDSFKYLGMYVSKDISRAVKLCFKKTEKIVNWFRARIELNGRVGDTILGFYLNTVISYNLSAIYLWLRMDFLEKEKPTIEQTNVEGFCTTCANPQKN